MKKVCSFAGRYCCAAFTSGVLLLGLLLGQSHADSISWDGNTVEMEFVTIGDTNNAADTEGTPTNCGAVAYTYRIGKHEVSGHQYSSMYGPGNENHKPKSNVTWYEAARFCNWLTTGNTETGLYVFVDGTFDSIRDRAEAAGQYGVVYGLPTEDEWYKAAYYDPGKPGGAGYWDYPDGTNVIYARSPAEDDGTAANVNNVAAGTTVAIDAYSLSASPYGTQQQGGNVFEWNELLIGTNRGFRGGSYFHGIEYTHRDGRGDTDPAFSALSIGFRVVSIGEAFYHTIIATSEDHGSITPDQGVSVRNGSNVLFTITADEYWHIADVTTNGASIGGVTSFVWSNVTDRGVVHVSIDPDLAAGGTPHWWLADNGWTNNFDEAELSNTDEDSYTTAEEYVLDYDPTTSNSHFRITAFSNSFPVTVFFSSSSNRLYSLCVCSNLAHTAWTNVAGVGPRMGTGAADSLSDTNMPPKGKFYRLRVDVP